MDYEQIFEIDLTPMERGTLARLRASYPNPVSAQTLLNDVWDYSPNAVSRTLESTIDRLRKKLPDGMIRTVRGEGYQLVQPTESIFNSLIARFGMRDVVTTWMGREVLIPSEFAPIKRLGLPESCWTSSITTEVANQTIARELARLADRDDDVLSRALRFATPTTEQLTELGTHIHTSTHPIQLIDALASRRFEGDVEYHRISIVGSLEGRTNRGGGSMFEDESVTTDNPNLIADRHIRHAIFLMGERDCTKALDALERAEHWASRCDDERDVMLQINAYRSMALTDLRDRRAGDLFETLLNSHDHDEVTVQYAYYEMVMGDRDAARRRLKPLKQHELQPISHQSFLIVTGWLSLETDLEVTRNVSRALRREFGDGWNAAGTYAAFFAAMIELLEPSGDAPRQERSEGLRKFIDAENPVHRAFARAVLNESLHEQSDPFRRVAEDFDGVDPLELLYALNELPLGF